MTRQQGPGCFANYPHQKEPFYCNGCILAPACKAQSRRDHPPKKIIDYAKKDRQQ